MAQKPIVHRLSYSDRFSIMSTSLGQIAHDLNNLLTPLVAYPSLIRNELPEGSSAVALVETLEKTARDMLHITTQLLALSPLKKPSMKSCDINPIVSDLVEVLRKEHARDNLTIEMELTDKATKVDGSVDDISMAVRNVCLNSAEAIGEDGGVILIQTEVVTVEKDNDVFGEPVEEGEYVRVTVSDTGPGIPDAIQPRIFDPLLTTKKSLGKRGSGVGLSIVYRVLTNHQGFVKFRSSPGDTTFDLYFKTARAAEEDAVADEGCEIPCKEGTLLVVDDERTIRKLFNMILSAAMPEFEVDLAVNGREALNMFKERHHSLIVMDLHMPVMDGQSAFFKIEKFCAENNWVMPPVVFCTGYAPPDSIRGVVSRNPKHSLLSKPVTGETLLQTIKSRL